jgi:hypothetical protein
MTTRRIWLCIVAIAIAAANFAAFYWIAGRIGGDAYHGYVENGHYFLATSHGRAVEVSGKLFEYSRWHVRSLLVTYPLGFACLIILVRWQKQLLKTVSR